MIRYVQSFDSRSCTQSRQFVSFSELSTRASLSTRPLLPLLCQEGKALAALPKLSFYYIIVCPPSDDISSVDHDDYSHELIATTEPSSVVLTMPLSTAPSSPAHHSLAPPSSTSADSIQSDQL